MNQNFKDIIISTLKRHGKKALTFQDLIVKNHITKQQKDAFQKQLKELQTGGLVLREGKHFRLLETSGLFAADIIRVFATFGFARTLEGDEIFIPGRYLMGAMPGDKVLIKRRKRDGTLDEGQVHIITYENDALISGKILINTEGIQILPDGGARYAIRVNYDPDLRVRNGDKVVASIERRGLRHSDHRADIVENFGNSETAENCAQAILAASGVYRDFTENILEIADKVSSAGIPPEDYEGREDLRDLPIFTIDSESTKDIDDAVSLEKTPTGYLLGVHIADVSHYVRYNSAIDKEAYERGTSVYYVDKVIPMLPPGFSNGICSLNPDEDRLAFSVFINIDEDGKMENYRFFKSVIRSRIKGVYSEINSLISGVADDDIMSKYYELIPQIKLMIELADLLYKRRIERGAIELQSTESKFIMTDDGSVEDIIPAKRGVTEELIESFMLMANQAAAAFAEERGIPFIFRVHENPPLTKLKDLADLLKAVGIDSTGVEEGISPSVLSRVLKESHDTSYNRLVNSSVLRSMAKAIYSDKNIGHFGLVMKQYSHFTSPIRRYPDLYIHRIMTQVLYDGDDNVKMKSRVASGVKGVAAHSSAAEQRAVQAERNCEDVYKAEFMHRYIGQTFEGVITSAVFSGFYVALPNTVEGLVKAERLPGLYDFDGKMSYKNRVSGHVYKVGDKVNIIVSAVSVSAGQVDFDIVKDENDEAAANFTVNNNNTVSRVRSFRRR